MKPGEGNSLNYKYRMHDPRLGRFFAIDPLISKYPSYSSYSFSGNKVIQCIELEGAEEMNATYEDGPHKGEQIFKPVFKLNLPNGEFVTIFGKVHGGPYAISEDDRNKINGFKGQGFSALPQNNFDPTFVQDNGRNINIQAGVGGVSNQNKNENGIPMYAIEGMFRVNSIQAPSAVTQTVPETVWVPFNNCLPVQPQLVTTFNRAGNNVPVPISTTNQTVTQQVFMVPITGRNINNVLAPILADPNAAITSISVDINNRLVPQAVQAFQQMMQGFQAQFPNAAITMNVVSNLPSNVASGNISVCYSTTIPQVVEKKQEVPTLEEVSE